ncbi:haloacid dehalogenase type II [Streptomyces diacarni]|uniref:Haloacid dehalogenase type II n=1 Tax=Streptomyces diacarni TaxID=2800381 RepID=A0A367FCV9_9ACTN|nr:haloacid dehalogenase type II [Streptomyces diacarni]RCG27525.1 haloacid dehalogenase type II [Streptomyces diacarni]
MRTAPRRPQAVVFDVLETLMRLEPLGDRFEEIGQPAAALQPWFLRVQRDCMALTLSGEVACSSTFLDAAHQALRVESGQSVSEAEIEHVLSGLPRLPAHPDALPALRRLREAGVRVGALTVGDAEVTRAFLEHNGLAPHVEQVVTAAEAGAWKPAPEVYRAAAERVGAPPAATALVAVHAWDCHGANRAGLLSGWCARLEGRHSAMFAEPDVVGEDLDQVAEGLLGLPTAGTR